MTKRALALVVVGGLCLAQAACSGGQPSGSRSDSTARAVGEEGAKPILPPLEPARRRNAEDLYGHAYRALKCGGSMYAGRVVSVTAEGHDDQSGVPCEWGKIGFRVARTLAGPPHKEMTIPFLWFGPDPLAGGE